MRILKVDKDTVQVELTREEVALIQGGLILAETNDVKLRMVTGHLPKDASGLKVLSRDLEEVRKKLN